MGKPTGFLEYARKTNGAVSPSERIKNYEEFHPPMTAEERQEQGARCMNCGVPFCQSGMQLAGMFTGCPLHNLIPEWNDAVFTGNWDHALSRLRKTNNFPEFTGRVCPALCEAACTCGLYGDPVTVRENELAIVETGFREGTMKPQIPEVRTGKKIAVIGSGPSGLACADQLNHRGHEVTVYEKSDRIGGLLMYGIPNMKLDKSVVERRVHLMEQEGVRFVTGADVGGPFPAEKILAEYDAVILCCGAKNPRDLNAEGRASVQGVCFAVDFLQSTTKALLDNGLKEGTFLSAKDKNVVIVGGGDTGNDCVGTCIRHGCKSVTQLEMMPKAPDSRAENNPWPQWPRICKVDYGQEEAIAKFGRDPRTFQITVKKLIPDEKGNLKAIETVDLKPEKDAKTGRTVMTPVPGTERVLDAELLIIAAGFLGPCGYIPEAFGVKVNARSNVETKPGSCRTNVEKVFAAGDMRRGQSLVVWAIAEGRAAAKEVDEYLMGFTNMLCLMPRWKALFPRGGI